MPNFGLLTDDTTRDSNEKFKEVTGSDLPGNKRGMDVVALSGLSIPPWDYVALTEAATTDTYTFRDGGSGGTIVAVTVITWTDSTKCTLANVERTT